MQYVFTAAPFWFTRQQQWYIAVIPSQQWFVHQGRQYTHRSPGRLGLTLAIYNCSTIGRRGSGARITKVDAACTFQNQVAVEYVKLLLVLMEDWWRNWMIYVCEKRTGTRIIHHRKTTEKCRLFPDQGGENMKMVPTRQRRKKRKAGDGDINYNTLISLEE